MKVALVHDQLQEFGGAERVLVALKQIYPEADVFTSFYNEKALGHHASKFKGWRIYTSWANKIPFLNKFYSPLRFITPLLWESFNFNEYDLVISSTGAYMSKGIITRPETLHLCYLHHPPKSLYFYETPLEWQKYWPIRIYATILNHHLRIYDYLASQRVDYFIANSEETKRRIGKFYRRDAEVVYPPVSLPKKEEINLEVVSQGYYLSVSRIARPKHMEVLVLAAKKYHFPLKIVGDGRDLPYLKSIADEYTEFLGNVSDDTLKTLYKDAKAFLYASVDEDFGIAPVEALGHGLPVIAYKSGGVIETIQDEENGFLYDMLSPDSLHEGIQKFEILSDERHMQMKKNAYESAQIYSEKFFSQNIQKAVKKTLVLSSTHI